MSELVIYKVRLRSFEISVVAVSLGNAIDAWKKEVSNNEAINYNGEDPDEVLLLSDWVAVSEKACQSYKKDLAERGRT